MLGSRQPAGEAREYQMSDHEKQPGEDVEPTDEAPEVKELSDDELSDVAGGSTMTNAHYPGSGT
jgi:hypothetical protein